MEQIALRHMHTELGRHLYALIRREPYESSTTLEDYTCSLPSGALVYRQLRARVYFIIQKSTKPGQENFLFIFFKVETLLFNLFLFNSCNSVLFYKI